jgi:hypothetical protein
MVHADSKLESGTESVYDRIRRTFNGLHLTLAVTQKTLQSLFILILLTVTFIAVFRHSGPRAGIYRKVIEIIPCSFIIEVRLPERFYRM